MTGVRSFTSSMVCPLGDGRLQFFVRADGALRTTWKTSADPNASWSGWDVIDLLEGWDIGAGELFAATSAPGRHTTLYGSAGERRQPDSPLVIGESLWRLRKARRDADSHWRASILYPGVLTRFRPYVEVVTQAVTAAAATLLPDGREQVVVQTRLGDEPPQLCARHIAIVADETLVGAESAFQPAPPAVFASLHFGLLSDDRPQLFGVTKDGGIFTCWRLGREAEAQWSAWQDFPAPPWSRAGAPPRLSPLRGADGALRLYSCANAEILVCEKQSADPNAGWSGWRGLGAPALRQERVLVDVLAAALPDGRRQLWATVRHVGLSPMEKIYTTFERNAAGEWADWEEFYPSGALG